MKLLITGTTGHLGEALMRTLKNKGHELVGIDLLPSPFTTHVGSIVNKDFVHELVQGCDYILHTATLHKPHVVTHTKQDFIDTNISGTLNLLEAAKQHGVKGFIFTSTTSTFGDAMRPKDGESATWITEAIRPIPKNIYGATKTTTEDLCQLFFRNHQLPCLILKTSRFFKEIDDNKAYRGAYKDLNIKANEFLYRRVDIQDAVDAHLLALEKVTTLGFGKYIISATTPFSKEDLPLLNKDANTVVQKYYPDFEAIYQARNWKMFPQLGRVYVNEKARLELGWQPKYDFRFILDGLKNKQPFWSPLAQKIGIKGYHLQAFENDPYPV